MSPLWGLIVQCRFLGLRIALASIRFCTRRSKYRASCERTEKEKIVPSVQAPMMSSIRIPVTLPLGVLERRQGGRMSPRSRRTTVRGRQASNRVDDALLYIDVGGWWRPVIEPLFLSVSKTSFSTLWSSFVGGRFRIRCCVHSRWRLSVNSWRNSRPPPCAASTTL
jgi:hypothetical protein